MKTYEYKGFNRDGQTSKGLIEALSVKEVRAKLAEQGVLVEKVSLTGRQLKFPSGTRALVYYELGSMLSAGLTLVHSLDVLIETPELGQTGILLA